MNIYSKDFELKPLEDALGIGLQCLIITKPRRTLKQLDPSFLFLLNKQTIIALKK